MEYEVTVTDQVLEIPGSNLPPEPAEVSTSDPDTTQATIDETLRGTLPVEGIVGALEVMESPPVEVSATLGDTVLRHVRQPGASQDATRPAIERGDSSKGDAAGPK